MWICNDFHKCHLTYDLWKGSNCQLFKHCNEMTMYRKKHFPALQTHLSKKSNAVWFGKSWVLYVRNQHHIPSKTKSARDKCLTNAKSISPFFNSTFINLWRTNKMKKLNGPVKLSPKFKFHFQFVFAKTANQSLEFFSAYSICRIWFLLSQYFKYDSGPVYMIQITFVSGTYLLISDWGCAYTGLHEYPLLQQSGTTLLGISVNIVIRYGNALKPPFNNGMTSVQMRLINCLSNRQRKQQIL